MSVLIATSLLWPGTAIAGGFLTPGPSAADEASPKRGYVAPAKRMEVDGDGADALLAELNNGEMRLREAWQNAFTAEQDYGRARIRRYPRGNGLLELETRAFEMGNEQIAAEQDFSRLVEKARRGGVPMGTLTPFMDLEDEIGQRRDERQDGGG